MFYAGHDVVCCARCSHRGVRSVMYHMSCTPYHVVCRVRATRWVLHAVDC